MLYKTCIALGALSVTDALSVGTSAPRTRTAVSSRTNGVTMELPRVVVTGMGIVSCLGTDLAEVTDNLYNCKPGISRCEEFAEVGMKSQVSGQPDFDWCAQKPSRFIPHTF